FDPVSRPFIDGITFWHPRFTPDPGVYDQLSTDDADLVKGGDGFHFGFFSLPYNPDDYTLTTRAGLGYRYNQFTGLEQITDRNGNTITFTAAGITSSAGGAVKFLRDGDGRIAEIDDPAGHAIKYDYDADGNLAAMTDQDGLVSRFTYRGDRPHYLDT